MVKKKTKKLFKKSLAVLLFGMGIGFFILALILAYDILAVIGTLDPALFSAGWTPVFEIRSGFIHALGIMFSFMLSSVLLIDSAHLWRFN